MAFSATPNRNRKGVMGNLRFGRYSIVDPVVDSGTLSIIDCDTAVKTALGGDYDIKHIVHAIVSNSDDEESYRICLNQNDKTTDPDELQGSLIIGSVTALDDGEVFVLGW